MTTSNIFLVIPVVLSSLSLGGWGCSSCSGDESQAVPTAASGGKAKRQKSSGGPATPKGISKDAPRTGLMLLVELPEERAHIWAEGQASSQERRMSNTRFSKSGFEWDSNGVPKVLGAGGGQYFRMGEPSNPLKNLSEFSASAQDAPEGYEVSWNVARGGLYQTELRIGPDQKLKMGRLAKKEPIAVHWFVGERPQGEASPALESKQLNWPEEGGVPGSSLPDGAEEIHSAASPEQQATWSEEIGKIRGAEVQLRQNLVVDLDRDEQPEGVACVTGGTGEYSCFVVDELGTERRYYGLYLGTHGDAPIQAFSFNGGHYLAWVGRLNLSTDAADPVRLHLARFDGGGYLTDVVNPAGTQSP